MTFERYIGLFLGIFAILGIGASLILSIERVNVLKDANHQLSCSINSAFNCASVMNSRQAEIFGFPNTFIGLIGYSLILMLGWVLFTEGRVRRLTIALSLIGSAGAFIFSYWLLYESVFVIQALCIYCLTSCFAATNIVIIIKLYALKANVYRFKDETYAKLMNFVNKGYYWPIIAIWYFALFVIVYLEFQSRF